MSAWPSIHHSDFVLGFLDVGIANDLHGSEDHRMSTDIQRLWADCGMSKRREEIRAWVKEWVDNGSWSQYRNILSPYADLHEQEARNDAFEWVEEDKADVTSPDVSAVIADVPLVPHCPPATASAPCSACASYALIDHKSRLPKRASTSAGKMPPMLSPLGSEVSVNDRGSVWKKR